MEKPKWVEVLEACQLAAEEIGEPFFSKEISERSGIEYGKVRSWMLRLYRWRYLRGPENVKIVEGRRVTRRPVKWSLTNWGREFVWDPLRSKHYVEEDA